jgi:hypothetical protein
LQQVAAKSLWETFGMGRVLRARKHVDYHKKLHKYDKYSFKPGPALIKAKLAPPPFAGRANAAPPMTSWPLPAMHKDVVYCNDIAASPLWVGGGNVVQLPFAHLDVDPLKAKCQGLLQEVAIGGDAAARLHFDAVTAQLLIAKNNPTITEAVGEAAAAMAMLAAGGWEMLWGFHLHAGTGIDQIWRKPIGHGQFAYHIVEAKGPGAGLTPGLFLPPNYAQMEFGWVINHLCSMHQNGHAAGTEIVNALGLTFNIAHPHYLGGSKSYFGLASKGVHATNRLTGQVFTASWLADGRLGWAASPSVCYI